MASMSTRRLASARTVASARPLAPARAVTAAVVRAATPVLPRRPRGRRHEVARPLGGGSGRGRPPATSAPCWGRARSPPRTVDGVPRGRWSSPPRPRPPPRRRARLATPRPPWGTTVATDAPQAPAPDPSASVDPSTVDSPDDDPSRRPVARGWCAVRGWLVRRSWLAGAPARVGRTRATSGSTVRRPGFPTRRSARTAGPADRSGGFLGARDSAYKTCGRTWDSLWLSE